MKPAYVEQLNVLITRLNTLSSSDEAMTQTREILHQINELDKTMLAEQGISVQHHFLFSRHGSSKPNGKKRLGLMPNAGLEDDAIANMAISHQLTGGLLIYPKQSLSCWVSPLIRAKQTANLLLPTTNTPHQIRLNEALLENSTTPSGNYITNKEQFNLFKAQYTFWRSPLTYICYFLAALFYADKTTLQSVKQLSDTEDQKLADKTSDRTTDLSENSLNPGIKGQDNKCHQLTDDIEAVSQQPAQDHWFFGHGHNLKILFKSLFNFTRSLNYCETHRVYQYTNADQQTVLFHPSYHFYVDQQTGLLKAEMAQTELATKIMPQVEIERSSTCKMLTQQPTIAINHSPRKATSLAHDCHPAHSKASPPLTEDTLHAPDTHLSSHTHTAKLN